MEKGPLYVFDVYYRFDDWPELKKKVLRTMAYDATEAGKKTLRLKDEGCEILKVVNLSKPEENLSSFLRCCSCGRVCSTALPPETIVRGIVYCPECAAKE